MTVGIIPLKIPRLSGVSIVTILAGHALHPVRSIPVRHAPVMIAGIYLGQAVFVLLAILTMDIHISVGFVRAMHPVLLDALLTLLLINLICLLCFLLLTGQVRFRPLLLYSAV